MTRPRTVVGFFAIVSMLSFVVALIPVLKDGPLNLTFLGSGVVFLVVAIATAKKNRKEGSGLPPNGY